MQITLSSAWHIVNTCMYCYNYCYDFLTLIGIKEILKEIKGFQNHHEVRALEFLS